MQMNKEKTGDSIERGKQMFKEQKVKNQTEDVDGSFISSIAGVSLQEANEIGSKNDHLLSGIFLILIYVATIWCTYWIEPINESNFW